MIMTPTAPNVQDLVNAATIPVDALRRCELRTAADALRPQPPIEWVIENLFSAGSVSLVVGEGGCKKTWLMLDAAVCVATGAAWLDRQTKQGAVLVVDEESGNRRLSERIGKALRGHKADSQTPLFYISLAHFDFSHSDDINELDGFIRQTDACLVIIDALADVMPGRDENAVKDVQPLFGAFRRVAETTGAAIVIIHHSNKGGDYRGSSAMKAAVDSLLKISSDPDSTKVDIKTIKVRDTEPVRLAAIANFGQDTFTMSPSIPDDSVKLSKSQDFVISYLVTYESATVDEIANAADICAPATARAAVYNLAGEKMGCVRRTDTGGAGGRGKKASYCLTEKGREYAEKQIWPLTTVSPRKP